MSRKNFEVEYLCEFEAIFKNILGGYLGAQGWLNCEKTGGQKSRDTVPLKPTLWESYRYWNPHLFQ